MNKKKDNYVILIIICLILISIVGLLFLNNEDKNIESNNKPKYVLLNDYSRFFTVNSCIYKFISFISSDDVNNVIDVLDEEYISINNITSDNVYNFIHKLEGNYTFKAKKIYYEEVDKNYITYYVYGELIEEILDEIPIKQEEYYKVNLDLKNQLFSIAPYDGKIFKEGL